MRPQTKIISLVLTLAAVLVPAASASADDLCVGVGGCAPAQTYAAADLQQALNDAAATAQSDNVSLGAGTWDGPINYLSPNEVHIAGAGTGQTKITVETDNAAALHLAGNPASTVSDLELSVIDGNFGTGLQIDAGAGDHLLLTSTPSALNPEGVLMPGTADKPSLTHSTVHIVNGCGIVATNAELADLTIDAPTFGLWVRGYAPNTVDATHLRVFGANMAIRADFGTLNLADSLLIVPQGKDAAIVANAGSSAGHDTTVNARRVTAVAEGAGAKIGA